MNAYPIGNDLTVKWSLLYSDGSVFPLSNYDYEFSYRTNRGHKIVTDTSVISVEENILTWTFKSDEQVVSGRYTLCLKITLSGSKVIELQYDNAFMLSPISGFKGAGSEIVIQSYCDAIDLKDAVLQARKAMDLAADAVIDTAKSAEDAKAAKAAAEVAAAQAKADATSAMAMAMEASGEVAVAEQAATDASRDAAAAQQAAQIASDHITSLEQAIAELPDGQAVSEKVAEHTTKLTDLGQNTYNLVPVNSSDELYYRNTVHLGKDLRTQDGVEVDSLTWNCSPFIPIDVNVPLFVTAYSNYVYLYDSTQAYLGRLPITNGRTIASYGSQYLSTAYIRIIYNNTMLYTARVGLTEHENLVKDYFIYDNQPVPGSQNIVSSGGVYKFTNGFKISQGGVIYDYSVVAGKKYFIKNTGNVFGLSVLFYENGTVISEISLNLDEYAIYDAQSSSSGIKLSNVAGVSAIIYEMSSIGGKVAKAQKDIAKVQEDIIGFPVTITKSKYNLVKGETYVISNIGSYQYPLNVYGYDFKDNEYTLVSNLLPNETRTFVVSKNGLVYIKLSSVAGASAIIYETSSIGGKVAQTQKNPIHLRVATFNVGDYTGKTFDVGSEDGKLLHRKLIGESDVNIFGTQEDTANYGGANIASSFWQMFKYYERLGNSNYNYKAFASDFPIVGIKQVFYTNTETYQFRHPWFLDGILYINGREIHLASFHFDWSDNDTRREQIRQIIEYYSTCENAILMGDTNCENYVNEQPQVPHNLYDVEWPIFADAGYDMANDGYFGIFNTVGYDEQTQYPLDNIFIKGNIRIKNADIIVKDWTNDHCLLYADLAIY